MKDKEIWKDIHGYSGYKISNMGNIKSFKVYKNGKLLTGTVNEKGYIIINLFNNNKPSFKRLHRLVLETFVGPCPIKHEACHNDGNPKNNRLDNLRCDTPKNNQLDRIKHGTDNCGSKSPHAKLSEKDVKNIFKLNSTGLNSVEISKKINATPRHIRKILNKERWTHLD